MINGADARIGWVYARDVLAMISALEAGHRPADDLYSAYMELVLNDGRTPGTLKSFSRMMVSLGCERLDVWKVDPGYIQRRWGKYFSEANPIDRAETPPPSSTLGA